MTNSTIIATTLLFRPRLLPDLTIVWSVSLIYSLLKKSLRIYQKLVLNIRRFSVPTYKTHDFQYSYLVTLYKYL